MKALRGVIAAAATPLGNNLSIDLDHLVRHCRWLLGEGGCDGVNLLGTTGEATSFSIEGRITAMRAVEGAGLPLDRFLVGTGAAALGDAVRLTAEAKALGFAGALYGVYMLRSEWLTTEGTNGNVTIDATMIRFVEHYE